MNRTHRFLSLVILALGATAWTWASPVLDDLYGYRNLTAIVANTDQEPVFGEQVESELIKQIKRNERFEFNEKAYAAWKSAPPVTSLIPEAPTQEAMNLLKKQLLDLSPLGARAIILGKVFKKQDNYHVLLMLLNTGTGELVRVTDKTVDSPAELSGFSAAATDGFSDLASSIPFDATVIRRDGYDVVLDRGNHVFHRGMEIPAYTIERSKNEELTFEQTGLIAVTEADENLTFGKILVEKRPREVRMENKIRLGDSPIADVTPLLPVDSQRSPSSLFGSSETEFEITKGNLGTVDGTMGPGLVSYTVGKIKSGATTQTSNSLFSPEGVLHGELWLTSRYYSELSLRYGIASTTTSFNNQNYNVGNSISDFRFALGYRINLNAPETGPILHFKVGYTQESYSFGTPNAQILLPNVSYSGLMIGAGARFPLAQKFDLAVDLNTLIFPVVTASQMSSSAQFNNVAAWDLGARAIYNYTSDLDLALSLIFQHNSAQISSDPVFASTDALMKSLLFGLSYYF